MKDDACFFKMNKADAYMILQDIGVSQSKIPAIYEKLISAETYFYLQKSGKLKGSEKELVIKYKNYDIF